jgi:hypothetical protein
VTSIRDKHPHRRCREETRSRAAGRGDELGERPDALGDDPLRTILSRELANPGSQRVNLCCVVARRIREGRICQVKRVTQPGV